MSPCLDRQSELPRTLDLLRYNPKRAHFSWRDLDPTLVKTARDLPEYLILGRLDPATFRSSDEGWTARWQGAEDQTFFYLAYKTDSRAWEVGQTWCGLDGGCSIYSTRVPLSQVIGQALYRRFPSSWESAARSHIESEYQATFVEQPEDSLIFCGIPDGAFWSIVFPIAVHNLRPVRQWLQSVINKAGLSFPVAVEAKLVYQAVTYLEHRVSDWSGPQEYLFHRSVLETGLAPQNVPEPELASDGTEAWTLIREVYYLFIDLPFAGLIDLLSRMATENGPIRTNDDPHLRFELRPIVLPAGFDGHTESMVLWDRARTTRCATLFTPVSDDVETAPKADEATTEGFAASELAKAEEISSAVVGDIERVFHQLLGDPS